MSCRPTGDEAGGDGDGHLQRVAPGQHHDAPQGGEALALLGRNHV